MDVWSVLAYATFMCLVSSTFLILDFVFQEFEVVISIYIGSWRKLAWENFVTAIFFNCVCKFCKFVNFKEKINKSINKNS